MKIYFKIFAVFLLIVLLFISGTSLYLYKNKQLVSDFIVEQVNSNINGTLKVRSSDISIFENFPNVSLDLKEVLLTQKGQKVIEAKHLYTGFNIKDIFNKKYRISVITLENAEINFLVNKKGKANFDLLKDNNEKKPKENFLVNLENVVLKNVTFSYLDETSKQKYNALIYSALFSGKFSQTKFDLNTKIDALVKTILVNKIPIVNNQHVYLSSKISINHQISKYQFANTQLKVNELDLTVNGNVQSKSNGNYLDIEFNSKKIGITNLLSILPIKIPKEILAYKSNGEVYFNGFVKGLMNKKNNPEIKANFGVSNGSISNQELNIGLKKISFKGFFSNGANRNFTSSSLELKGIEASLMNDEIKGNVSIKNLLNPTFNLALLGKLNIENVLKLFPVSAIENAKGSMDFNTTIQANFSSNKLVDNWIKNNNQGKFVVNLNALKLKNFDQTIDQINADFELKNADLNIGSCDIKLKQSDIKLNGRLTNFLQYVFEKNSTLTAQINYQSNFVDLEQVLFFPAAKSEKKDNKTLNIPQNIQINLQASIAKVKYKNFKAEDLSCNLQVLPSEITLNQAKLNAFNGKLSLNAKIINSVQGNYFVESKVNLSKININEAFFQCNNFGQTNITNQNLKGIFNGSVDFAGVWDKNLQCKTDKIYALVQAQITQGELVNYEPLKALSKYISLSDLQNIKFAELKNTIEIKERTVLIPTMMIENTALNITLNGSQNFDNFMDMNLKLNLSEVLRKKLKAKENEFGEEDEKKKGLNLFINMRGPVDNLKFTYNKKEVKQNLKENIKKEGETIKDLLKKEFKIDQKKDQPKEKKDDNNEELEFESE